jgi:hypothetical protein
VCDENGKFLEPIKKENIFSPFSFPYSFSNIFIGETLITVETHWNLEENCSINLHKIINTHDSIYMVETKTIWGGSY